MNWQKIIDTSAFMSYITRRNVVKQHNTVQSNAVPYNTMQHDTTQYNTLQYNTMQHRTMPHNTTLYSATQHNTIHTVQKKNSEKRWIEKKKKAGDEMTEKRIIT